MEISPIILFIGGLAVMFFMTLFGIGSPIAVGVITGVFMLIPVVGGVIGLLTDIEQIKVATDTPAKVIINERTGTIVVGGSVRITPIAVAHQGLSVKITTDYAVSQPAPLSVCEVIGDFI